MKSRIDIAVIILLLVTACNGTFEVGLENPPTGCSNPGCTFPYTTSFG